MLFDYRPQNAKASKEGLLQEAIKHSDECDGISKGMSWSQTRNNEPDKTGIGIAALKKAQALYVARNYAESRDCAVDAAGILAGYPNNRWWRMCCHDVASRCWAKLGDIARAEEHIEIAWNVFAQSDRNDHIRECELLRTEGIIAMADGRMDDAVLKLLDSLSFKTVHHLNNPCIEAAHLADLASAQLAAGRITDARKTLARAARVKVEW